MNKIGYANSQIESSKTVSLNKEAPLRVFALRGALFGANHTQILSTFSNGLFIPHAPAAVLCQMPHQSPQYNLLLSQPSGVPTQESPWSAHRS